VQPSRGSVSVPGRVAALLELGSGFHPEFTGRQNVLLNAAILGLDTAGISRRMPEIEEFAAIGSFIDQPVRTYSSGMMMRLAFAVATAVEPEVLLVDEALAVGDAAFRHKCLRRVSALRSRGVTIVFVSHSLSEVRSLGDRVLWLHHGEVVECGDPESVVDRYAAEMVAAPAQPAAAPETPARESIPNVDHRHGRGLARITSISVVNQFGEPVHLMVPSSQLTVRLRAVADAALASAEIGFLLRNHLGLNFSSSSAQLGRLLAGEAVSVDFHLEIPELYPGAFSFSPWIKSEGEICDWIDNALSAQMARGEGPVYGYLQVPCRVETNSLPVNEGHR